MAATISRGNLRPSSRCVIRRTRLASAGRVRESVCLSSMVGVRSLWGLLVRVFRAEAMGLESCLPGTLSARSSQQRWSVSPAVGLRHTKRALFAYWGQEKRELCAILVSYMPLGLRFHPPRVRTRSCRRTGVVRSLVHHIYRSRRCSAPCSLPAALLFQKPAKAPATPARGTAHARGTPAPRRLTYAIAAPDDKTAWI